MAQDAHVGPGFVAIVVEISFAMNTTCVVDMLGFPQAAYYRLFTQ